ncbi:MAG: hypothetical protein QM811_18825 [Pirellulales bacterium]
MNTFPSSLRRYASIARRIACASENPRPRVGQRARLRGRRPPRRALPLYEGAKVNVNHPRDALATAPRDYQDRLGTLADVRLDPTDGLFGDLGLQPDASAGRATAVGRRTRAAQRRPVA